MNWEPPLSYLKQDFLFPNADIAFFSFLNLTPLVTLAIQ